MKIRITSQISPRTTQDCVMWESHVITTDPEQQRSLPPEHLIGRKFKVLDLCPGGVNNECSALLLEEVNEN